MIRFHTHWFCRTKSKILHWQKRGQASSMSQNSILRWSKNLWNTAICAKCLQRWSTNIPPRLWLLPNTSFENAMHTLIQLIVTHASVIGLFMKSSVSCYNNYFFQYFCFEFVVDNFRYLDPEEITKTFPESTMLRLLQRSHPFPSSA